MDVFVVYENKYFGGFGSHWTDRNPQPVAAFTTLKAANAYKRDRGSRARDYYFAVRKLKVEE